MTVLQGRPTVSDLGDLVVDAVLELGRTKLSLRDARALKAGDVVALHCLAGQDLTVRMNGHEFARGEAIVMHDWMCCRLIRMVPIPEDGPQEETTE